MAEIIGYDPITGDPIWDDNSMNEPSPEPLPTLDNNVVIVPPPVVYDTAVYMTSTLPQPDPADLPATTHQGIALTGREVWELVDSARWWRDTFGKPGQSVVVVLLSVDNVTESKAPIYKVDLSVDPIDISSARS